jgi:phosphoribosylformimino-5-aminoimidazole carboxamide ribonucleotide (ProFAR) isomerase
VIVYPAIDLRQGACVRLMHGKFEEVTRYDDQPAARLAAFAAAARPGRTSSIWTAPRPAGPCSTP